MSSIALQPTIEYYSFMVKKICETCKQTFLVHPYRFSTAKFCGRSCLGKSRVGARNSCWRGGRINREGYIWVYLPKHPFSVDGYYAEHRYITEQYLKRYLKPEEKIHHKNGIRNDNRIENLELMSTQSDHAKVHNKLRNKDLLGRYL